VDDFFFIILLFLSQLLTGFKIPVRHLQDSNGNYQKTCFSKTKGNDLLPPPQKNQARGMPEVVSSRYCNNYQFDRKETMTLIAGIFLQAIGRNQEKDMIFLQLWELGGASNFLHSPPLQPKQVPVMEDFRLVKS
jgi:hypothetical protein